MKTNDNYSDFRNLIKQYEITLIVYVLKRITDEEHALSCAELTDKLIEMIPSDRDDAFFNNKTTSRKMEIIDAIENGAEDFLCKLNNIFSATFGGKIRVREADGIYYKKNTRGKGTQKRYYFEPLLTTSDMDLIYGNIKSSRYLTKQEKNYLLKRLEVLHPTFHRNIKELEEERNIGIYDIEALPTRPQASRRVTNQVSIPERTSNFLSNAQMIYTAIEMKVQIEVIYGIYDVSENSMSVGFHIRNKNETPYILNPFALFWNDGEYYMIANSEKYPNPTHYRVDRIISVRIHKTQTENGDVISAPRGNIPEVLREFYERDEQGQVFFDGIRYANVYPEMAIYKSHNRIHCTFECTNWSLQMLIDNFGSNITVTKSDRSHDSSEVDYNGNPQEFLLATIRNVQYDNARNFAIRNCQNLTVISPESLVTDVHGALLKAATRLKPSPAE